MDILPAIDIRDGRVVRLIQGDYEREIPYFEDPALVAKGFEQAGAKWLHLVDLDGARAGRPCNLDVIRNIRKVIDLKIEFGGGMRTREAVEAAINAGAARVVVGTAALENLDWFRDLVNEPALRGTIALGLDARDGLLAVKGWTETTVRRAEEVAQLVNDWPIAAIIYTDIERDGMLLGPNFTAVGKIATSTRIPVIASGGVACLDDVKKLARLPVAGIIIGRAIYEGKIDVAAAIKATQDSVKPETGR